MSGLMRLQRRFGMPVLVVLLLVVWYFNNQGGEVSQSPATGSGVVEQAYADRRSGVWVEVDGRARLGRLDGKRIALFDGDLFGDPVASGQSIDPDDALWLPPVEPRQFLGLWNNFHERQQKEGTQIPDFPLFFVKLGESLSAHHRPITRPPGFSTRKISSSMRCASGTCS